MESNRVKTEKEYKLLEQQIREAEELKAKGDPAAAERLAELQRMQTEAIRERNASLDEEYIKERDRRRENRSFVEKVADAFTGEL